MTQIHQTQFTAPFNQVTALVKQFAAHEADYLAPSYSEAQVRQDFIDQFFHALGWDVYHYEQKNPYAQEVKIEAPIKIETSQRRADYALFIAPEFRQPKLLCEAKRPARDVRNADDYFQAVRYGWNRQTPLVLLFNFRELHFIDSRYKPDIATALDIWYKRYRYRDYANPEQFAEIYYLLARDEVANGAIERFVMNDMPTPAKGKAAKQKSAWLANYQPVDSAFLTELDRYRTILALAYQRANPTCAVEELTEAVQRTLDRLVFMRFLEDKQIEEATVKSFGKRDATWHNFLARSRALNDKYNGLIFKPSLIDDPQRFTPPEAQVFQAIIEQLADAASPYDFNSIPISILGSIYERFLGQAVTINALDPTIDSATELAIDSAIDPAATQAPDVRKRKGVYYTPEYIVRYIVQMTVGQLIANKTPDEIAQLRFADIACGSGSFLIEMYTVLLEYHARYYADHPQSARPGETELKDGVPVLTLKKRRDILQQCIFGVDIDFQAVEVSQLSLYLKMLEDATPHACFIFPQDYKTQILPDLSRNIICGNSLVGKDFWSMFGDEEQNTPQERRQVNAMNFNTVFPAIMQRGGFDVIVGNPPYVRQETLGERFKHYAKQVYRTYAGTADLFVYFIERSLNVLKPGGSYGVIVANKWLRANYGQPLRAWLKKTPTHQLVELIDFGDLRVFQGATTYPCILRLMKTVATDECNQPATFLAAEVKTLVFADLAEYVSDKRFVMSIKALEDAGWTLANTATLDLLNKLRAAGVALSEYVDGKIYRGVLTGLNEAFVIDAATKNQLIAADAASAELIKPFLAGRDIKRYAPPRSEQYLIFTRRGVDIEQYPAIKAHLLQFKMQLMPKPNDWRGAYWAGRKAGSYQWFEIQDAVDYYAEFEKPKIIYPNICKKPEFTLDECGLFTNQKCFIIPVPDKYLLAILNSKVTHFLFHAILPKLRGDFFEPSYVYFKDFSVPQLDLANETQQATRQQLVALVNEILQCKQEYASTLLDYRHTQLEMEIAALDQAIDTLVYALYGLNEAEIALIENTTRG
ncbi:Eco57I restriction-modification methylase domain-containing protein [Rhodoferax sp. 4810]|uniref:site-specific DNA-methyltransferase (adenine-specific) n=1 Tax=Thiospirillum jenense TaxID=1653858 RepID=A0A839H8P7_9GAMM|nr:Eco57I restriction-modification methylase domain-containing protein [Thiospirillum jenense]MBB1073410.1 Eco57I restriction-modification methylase domain-containing protein [Rhodoferax jenense]MBB1125763.1 Eco57I restriction-modification methylase domain-containing protein [Thiospirillum jenense]